MSYYSAELIRTLRNESAKWFTELSKPRRTVFDSIRSPMNVWKKQFTVSTFTVTLGRPQWSA